MNKKKLILALTIIILTVLAIFGLYPFLGKKPFANINEADISSASVQLMPPNKTIQITQLSKLADVLKDIVIYNKDDSYKEYGGQAVIITITMADGTKIVINAYNPFVVIDGIGYRTKYEQCERLSQFANDLLQIKE